MKIYKLIRICTCLFLIMQSGFICSQNSSTDLNPFKNIRPDKPPIFYIHGGAGFSMPGLLFSKEITNSLSDAVEGKWRIKHIDFPYSLSGATGLSNIFRIEYQVTSNTFRHDIKFTGDVIGTQSGPPYFLRVQETVKMKHRCKDILFMINPFVNNWLKDYTAEGDEKESTLGIFLIYGIGKMGYIDIEDDILSWRGKSNTYGIGFNSITKTGGFSFQIKYSEIDFRYAPLHVKTSDQFKASYISIHFNFYLGVGI